MTAPGPAVTYHALSLKQPWAALLVHGQKIIEVRRWATSYRGPLLIHAARGTDDRPEARALVPESLRATAALTGGIVGVGRLHAIKSYHRREAFLADRPSHLNDPTWFQPGLVGFCFDQLQPIAFRACPGWVRIFTLDLEGLEIPPALPEPSLVGTVLRRFRRVVRALCGSTGQDAT